MSLYSLADFRRLRDEHGLVLYADSVAAHRATLERLQDPEALRVGFVAEWERLEQMDLDELTREISQKQLKKRAREALSAARAAIAHEQTEIERVTALYHQARYQQEEDSMNISDTFCIGENRLGYRFMIGQIQDGPWIGYADSDYGAFIFPDINRVTHLGVE